MTSWGDERCQDAVGNLGGRRNAVDDLDPHSQGSAMSTTFEAATTVVPRDHDDTGRARYDVELVSEYSIMGAKPNGGYMLACLGRAALDAAREAGSTHEHVISASAQFLSSPDLGPAQIVAEVDRVGKTASQVSATIGVDGTLGVRAQFTLGTLHEGSTPFASDVTAARRPGPRRDRGRGARHDRTSSRSSPGGDHRVRWCRSRWPLRRGPLPVGRSPGRAGRRSP